MLDFEQNILIPINLFLLHQKQLEERFFLAIVYFVEACEQAQAALQSQMDYIGSEVDMSRVESSREKYPKYKFEKIPIISSAKNMLPWKDNSFDMIFVSLCLHHINAESCKLIIKEFRRVLKSDGKVLGIEPALIDGKYFSNILMNILDAGDYILPLNKYKNMYQSESFKTNHINIVKTFGYNLWQYSSVAVGDKSTEFKNDKTPIRDFFS